VALHLRDHGPGIPPDELESIFEAFVQSSRTRDGSGGTGLGLTICRKIMRAHGGHIEAANAEGGGAEMKLWLPAAGELPATAPPAAAPASTPPRGAGLTGPWPATSFPQDLP
jgi:signal transduction histidine kinase